MSDKLNIHRIIAAFAVLIFIGMNIYLFSDQTRYANVRLNTSRGTFNVKAELAETMSEQQRGLMYRQNLKVGEGMLFIFKKPHIVAFWMKNTLIPLDMIFIGEDKVIKYIEQKVPPCKDEGNNCPTYSPPVPAKYVLEVPGGYSKLFGVKKDDTVEILNSSK